jgi:hypothetical protein
VTFGRFGLGADVCGHCRKYGWAGLFDVVMLVCLLARSVARIFDAGQSQARIDLVLSFHG